MAGEVDRSGFSPRNRTNWCVRHAQVAAPSKRVATSIAADQSKPRPGLQLRHCGWDVRSLSASTTRPRHCPRLDAKKREVVIARNDVSQSSSRISPANKSVTTSSRARKNQSEFAPPVSESSSPASFSTSMVVFNDTAGLPTPARRLAIRVA